MNLFTVPLFPGLVAARFVCRLNRFVLACDLEGDIVSAHLPNPGRLWELLLPGRTVYLAKNGKSPRTTPYTAVAVDRAGAKVLLHTSMANRVVRFLLEEGRLPGWEGAEIIKAEAVFGHSRFDFLLRQGAQQAVLEVKSCTLFGRRLAMFPDAVSQRATRHLTTLAALSREGYTCGVVFVVSSPSAELFLPDYHTDITFARTLLLARERLRIKAVGVSWRDDLTLAETVRDIPIPWPLLEKEGRDQGAYLLLLHLTEDTTVTIGSLGPVFFPRGYYVYAGSARKNLAKRLERHGRKRKNLFWHIDYLREAAAGCQALPIRTADDLEHELARRLASLADWSIPRFGSSDCRCPTHLFGMKENPIRNPEFMDFLLDVRMDRLTTKNMGSWGSFPTQKQDSQAILREMPV